ncbi:hypothetical protein JX265_013580 [Neoarthrinium moseri]|uniref:DUF7357 domain-containing protein n=1 Tax=Neoarthrinium moseri TaxID=1658444 RepID=A0A9Q0AIK8_9PEZI|nr:hypothetical protein JX265_013580 [Neoarthrinium moseri]
MRLRLVVRRNGLPEANVVWPVPPHNSPTVAKLLEQVNDILPLESGEWGLEDYAVELRGSDGSSFECLHFQSVRDVLKDDDQIFIRPLFTDDLRRRRVSGRHQISTDGKHLIDGIAFGRPLLKAPRGRPAFDIPPRKRRRIGYEDHDADDHDEEDEDDADYEQGEEDEEEEEEDEEDTPMLLLTNGEDEHRESRRRSVRLATDFDNLDADDIDEEEPGSDENADHDDEDLTRELQDLQSPGGTHGIDRHSAERERASPLQDGQPRRFSRPGSPRRSRGRRSETPQPVPSSHEDSSLDLEVLDKISTLRAAFPAAPLRVCREILTAEDGDLRKSYLALLQGFKPAISESDLVKRWHQRLPGPGSSGNLETSPRQPPQPAAGVDESTAKSANEVDDDAQDQEDAESDEDDDGDVTPFVRRFDRQGLPPGTISSGNGLKAMAGISASFTSSRAHGESKATSATLTASKTSFDDLDEADEDDTSSSAASSSSGSSSEEGELSDPSSSDDSSSANDEDEDPASGDASNNEARSDSSTSSSEDGGDNHDDSDDDSGPEEMTAKSTAKSKPIGRTASGKDSSDATSSSSEDSDADDETSSSSESSDDESSDDDSSNPESSPESESDEDALAAKRTTKHAMALQQGLCLPSGETTQSQSPSVPSQHAVPPGQGKSATRKRNIRRREAERAKKQVAQAQTPEHTQANTSLALPISTSASLENDKSKEQELFEAKRQALLDALANGGVEVGPGSQSGLEGSIAPQTNKRKRNEADSAKAADTEANEVEASIPRDDSVTAALTLEAPSPDSVKRRRLDLGAGRRMLFGALGLRNPRTKDDEDNLRNRLMKDVRPLQNARLAEDDGKASTAETEIGKENAAENTTADPDAWKDRIVYRAVECCQADVVLSEPPFPFVQRWDPQQQGNWFTKKNKRGGRGKKAERNQLHFYQDDSRGTKGSYGDSQGWDESYYNEATGAGQESLDADVELNYDDVEQPLDSTRDRGDETTRLSDLDDLPPLPDIVEDLKPLQPGEAQNGMVITWKQYILSKATNWQPQLLSLTGVICRIDDNTAGLEVVLAKRDRDLEHAEKQYDDRTGQRIYDKFEAPDLGEEEDEDEDTRRANEGYRTLSFDTMMDPRIVQPAISLDETSLEPIVPSIEDRPEELLAETETAVDFRDTTFEGFGDEIEPQRQEAAELMDTTSELPKATKGHVETPGPGTATEQRETPALGTSNISSDDHAEQERQPANLSLSDTSQISSPSRQLQAETISQLLEPSPNQGTADDVSPVADEPTSEHAMTDLVSDGGEDSSLHIHDAELITGTPKVTYPTLMGRPSSAGSAHSGRQPDLSMDLGIAGEDSFRATTEGSINEDQNTGPSPLLGEDSTVVYGERDSAKPTPSPVIDQLNQKIEFSTKAKETPGSKMSSVPSSSRASSSSLASLNTLWCTATSSRRTQSPSRTQLLSSLKSQKSQAARNQNHEYEEAMQKLDRSSDDDVSEDASRISGSFRPDRQSLKLPTQFSSIDNVPNNDWDVNDSSSDRSSLRTPRAQTDVKFSTSVIACDGGLHRNSPESVVAIKTRESPPATRTRKAAQSSQPKFSVPRGTQVLEISSDSDDPKFAEDYADDDADEKYSPASPPKGSRWAKKSNPTRSSTAPLASQKGLASKANVGAISAPQNSYGPQLKDMESAAAVIKRIKGKGKRKSYARI